MKKVDGGVAITSIKNFPMGLHVMYLYAQDTPRTFKEKRVTFGNVKPLISTKRERRNLNLFSISMLNTKLKKNLP
jgi:hypothetical protein